MTCPLVCSRECVVLSRTGSDLASDSARSVGGTRDGHVHRDLFSSGTTTISRDADSDQDQLADGCCVTC